MIKELMHDPVFLAGKSEVATKEDLPVARDLLETLIAHRDGCVGKPDLNLSVPGRPGRRILFDSGVIFIIDQIIFIYPLFQGSLQE